MDAGQPYVRIAEIEIDPARGEAYRAALRAEIETSVRVEPGVLALARQKLVQFRAPCRGRRAGAALRWGSAPARRPTPAH